MKRIWQRGTTMNTGYRWEEVYKAAMLKTDHGKLRNRVQSAKAAIDARLHDLQMGGLR
jgi:hypothetical protein